MKNMNGMKWGIRALCLAAASTVCLTAAAQVKISQVCGVGAGASTAPNADFVELFNAGTAPVDISTWSVQVSSGAGTSWTRLNIPSGTIMPVGSYLTIRLESATATPGYTFATDLQASPTITTLSSGGGIVALMNNQTTLTSCPSASANKVDLFGYGSATCREGTTKAQGTHTFGSNISFQRNLNGCTDTDNNNVDFTNAVPVFKAGRPFAATGTISAANVPNWTNTTINVSVSPTAPIVAATNDCTTSTFVPAAAGSSTGQVVTVDFGPLGGGVVTLTGVDGGPFTGSYSYVAGAVAAGNKTLPVVITDTQGRTLNTSFATRIVGFTDLGTISTCPAALNTTIAAGEVKWYKFSLPVAVSAANNNYLDMNTEGSTASFDTYMALYNGTGAKVAEDDDDGSGLLSALSFGATTPTRPAVITGANAAGVVYNGRDGSLAVGDYYLAALAYSSTNVYGATGWNVVSNSTLTGTFNANIRYVDLNSVGGSAPTVFNDLGTIPTDGTFVSGTVNIGGPGQFKWFKFTTGAIDAANPTRTYLDLDTEGSAMTTNAMAMYDPATGNKLFEDAGSGSGNYSQLSFGKGTRPAVGDGTAYDGRTAATLAAGTYYVVVAPALAAGNGWSVQNCGTALGNITLRARSGFQPVTLPTPDYTFTFSAPAACSSTTLSSPGEAVSAAGQVKWYKLTLPAIDRALNQYLDISSNGTTISGGSFTDDTQIGLYGASGGAVIVTDDDDGQDAQSALTFGAQSPTRTNGTNGTAHDGRDGATLAAGDYYLAVSEYALTAGTDYAATSSGGGTGTIKVNVTVGQFGTITTGTPASFTDLGALVADGNFATQNLSLAAGEVKWFKFTTGAIAAASRTYLDIDTEGSTGVTATSLALFNSTGVLEDADTVDGTDTLSQLSYGFTTGRPAPGNGVSYNGRDGATLAAGDYWVAVSSSTAAYSANWGNTNCGTASGSAKLNIRTGTAPPAAPPAGAIDLGVVRSIIDTANPGQFLPGVKTTGPIAVTGNPVVWAKFSIRKPTLTSGSPINYVDVHSIGSSTPAGSFGANDTDMALFFGPGLIGAGNVKDENDDFNGGTTTGRESMLSYGQTSPARTYTGSPNGTASAVGGLTGLGAGTYYVAVTQWNGVFANEYSASGAAATGSLQITVVSNQPAWCNDSDVAAVGTGVGGGPDGQNTVDDIIGYLGEFFANNTAVADLITLGGALPAQPDGQVTVDDLIYFLNQFFAPCVP